jgi:hypothetical protein
MNKCPLFSVPSCEGIITFFLFIHGAGVEQSSLLLRPFIGLLYEPWVINYDYGAINGMNKWQVKPQYSEETWSSVALSTTDPASWPGPEPGPPQWERGD